MAKDTQKVDGAKLLKELTAAFDTKDTKRGGKSGYVLIQHDGRTLAMASVKSCCPSWGRTPRVEENLLPKM